MESGQEGVQGDYGGGTGRSIFPLPLSGGVRRPTSKSRRSQQRWRKQRQEDGMVDEVITNLNSVWARAGGQGRRRRRSSRLVREALTLIRHRVRQFRRQSRLEDGGGVNVSEELDGGLEQRMSDEMSEILGVQYESVKHVRLTAENISLPQVDGGQVGVLELLPLEWASRLSSGEGVVLHGPAPPTPTYHGVLPGDYPGVVEACVRAGVAEYTTSEPVVINGLFGVAKPDGTARVIVEARAANAHFLEAPDPCLPRPEALGKLGVPPGCRLHGGLLDLDQYYHRLVLPEWYRNYFGLPPVVGADGVKRWVRWRTVPMGWSWAVFISQLSHTHVLGSRCSAFRGAQPLAVPVPRLLGRREVASAAYIDDLGVLGVSRRRVNRVLRGYRRAEAILVKDRKYQPARTGMGTRIWGIQLDEFGGFRPVPSKLDELIDFSRAVIDLTFCKPKLLQRLVGKWLWVSLLVRPLLSLFRPLFRQACCKRRRVRLWASSIRALHQLVGLAPLLVVDPSRPHGHVLASDASDLRGGVCVGPRVSSELYWSLSGFVYYKGRADLASVSYSEELGKLIRSVQFPYGFGWRWQNVEEIIMVKESRALLTSFLRALSSSIGTRHRHLALVDNQPAVFAFTKGTSRHPVINALISRVAVLSLATGSTLDLAWCRSADQPADAVSRGRP